MTPLRADGLLLLTALIWGIGFVPQQLAMAHVGPLAFTGLRFLLGALCLLLLLAGRRSRAAAWPWRGGALAGLALSLAAILQQIGVAHTTVGSAGFISGLYVVFVPILGTLVKRPARRAHWVGALMAMIGLYFLSVGSSLDVQRGDLFVLASAVCWAVQILLIDRFAAGADTLRLAIIQFAFVGVLSGGLAPLVETPSVAGMVAAGGEILYGGVLAVGVAFTLQIPAQRAALPAHAALLFSLEAVFAAVSGRLLLDELLGPRQLLGCAVIFAGILCSQLDRLLLRPARAGQTGP